MSVLPEACAALMLAALVLYALTAGADFGGGMWDLLASGPRAERQRRLIEQAIAPVWEANHVWLIFLLVILFTAFPLAFSIASIALHVPLTLMLLGIVLRGSAFTFRHYGAPDTATQRRWGRVFSISSVATPWFLGVSLAAVTSGRITVEGHRFTGDFFSSWLGAFPALVGGFTLALFAFLAATYLTRETDDPALQEDFRRRALLAGLAVGAFAFAAAVAVGSEAPAFRARLFGAWWSWPLQVGTGAAALLALGALWRRRYLLARVAAIVQVSLLLVGWALSQHPLLIAPAITVKGAAAPPNTLVLLLVVSGIGALVLVPSLYLLLRVFKGAPAANGE